MKAVLPFIAFALASTSFAQGGEYYYVISSPQIYWMATEYHCLVVLGSDEATPIDSVDMTYAWIHKRYESASWGPNIETIWEDEVAPPDVNETKEYDYTWGGVTLAPHKNYVPVITYNVLTSVYQESSYYPDAYQSVTWSELENNVNPVASKTRKGKDQKDHAFVDRYEDAPGTSGS